MRAVLIGDLRGELRLRGQGNMPLFKEHSVRTILQCNIYNCYTRSIILRVLSTGVLAQKKERTRRTRKLLPVVSAWEIKRACKTSAKLEDYKLDSHFCVHGERMR